MSLYTTGAGWRGGDGSHFALLLWIRGDGLLREGGEISCRDGKERVGFLNFAKYFTSFHLLLSFIYVQAI